MELERLLWICATADFEDELHTLLQQEDELDPGLDVNGGPECSYHGRTWRLLLDVSEDIEVAEVETEGSQEAREKEEAQTAQWQSWRSHLLSRSCIWERSGWRSAR